MTREEALEFIGQSIKPDVDMAMVADALKTLEQEPKTEDVIKAIIDECNKRQECKGCKYIDRDILRCKFRDIPSTWEIE